MARGSVRTIETTTKRDLGTKTGRETTTEVILVRGSGYLDRSTLLEETEANNVPDANAEEEESWGGEETAQDKVDSKDPDFQDYFTVRPLWILYKGRLMWASSSIGRDVQVRELFRRRIQAFLDFLVTEKQFPDKSDEDRLLAMQGLFVMKKEKTSESIKPNAENVPAPTLRDIEPENMEGSEEDEDNQNGKDKTTWLERLDGVGIIYGEGKILPLSALRTGVGQRQESFPEPLAHLWLERELEKRPYEKEPLNWENCKEWIVKIEGFYEAVSKQLNSFQEEVEGSGLGLQKRNFAYNEDTLQHKHLVEWKKWWSEYQKKEAGK